MIWNCAQSEKNLAGPLSLLLECSTLAIPPVAIVKVNQVHVKHPMRSRYPIIFCAGIFPFSRSTSFAGDVFCVPVVSSTPVSSPLSQERLLGFLFRSVSCMPKNPLLSGVCDDCGDSYPFSGTILIIRRDRGLGEDISQRCRTRVG